LVDHFAAAETASAGDHPKQANAAFFGTPISLDVSGGEWPGTKPHHFPLNLLEEFGRAGKRRRFGAAFAPNLHDLPVGSANQIVTARSRYRPTNFANGRQVQGRHAVDSELIRRRRRFSVGNQQERTDGNARS
jgi:hypothetical protein